MIKTTTKYTCDYCKKTVEATKYPKDWENKKGMDLCDRCKNNFFTITCKECGKKIEIDLKEYSSANKVKNWVLYKDPNYQCTIDRPILTTNWRPLSEGICPECAGLILSPKKRLILREIDMYCSDKYCCECYACDEWKEDKTILIFNGVCDLDHPRLRNEECKRLGGTKDYPTEVSSGPSFDDY